MSHLIRASVGASDRGSGYASDWASDEASDGAPLGAPDGVPDGASDGRSNVAFDMVPGRAYRGINGRVFGGTHNGHLIGSYDI